MTDVKPSLDPRGSVLLALTTRAQMDVSAVERVYRELQKVDPRALLITLDDDASNARELETLLWYIGTDVYCGLLVTMLTGPASSKDLERLLLSPADTAITLLSQVNQSVHCFADYPEHGGLALADRYGRRGGKAIILTAKDITFTNKRARLFKFDLVDVSFGVEHLFHMYLAPERFFLVPPRRSTLDQYIDPKPLEALGAYSPNPASVFTGWLFAEFGTEEAAENALSTIQSAICVTSSSEIQKPPFLDRRCQLLICALRLARCIATWYLEGEPFECSLLLPGRTPATGSVFKFDPPIPFALDHENELRRAAESAQSDELFLVVDVNDNQLKSVDVLFEQPKPSRVERFKDLAVDGTVLIHIRSGFVEVYANRELALWHAGFHWIIRPFSLLQHVLDEHFRPYHANAGANLLNAIALLMDRQQGSTLVLLHSDDDVGNPATDGKGRFQTYAGTALRENVKDEDSQLDIAKIPSSPLASIIRMDGAHAITRDARLKYVARQIEVPADLEVRVGGGSGTGTRAAEYLSGCLPMSIVIRISSGGRIRIFQKGQPLSSSVLS